MMKICYYYVSDMIIRKKKRALGVRARRRTSQHAEGRRVKVSVFYLSLQKKASKKYY